MCPICLHIDPITKKASTGVCSLLAEIAHLSNNNKNAMPKYDWKVTPRAQTTQRLKKVGLVTVYKSLELNIHVMI